MILHNLRMRSPIIRGPIRSAHEILLIAKASEDILPNIQRTSSGSIHSVFGSSSTVIILPETVPSGRAGENRSGDDGIEVFFFETPDSCAPLHVQRRVFIRPSVFREVVASRCVLFFSAADESIADDEGALAVAQQSDWVVRPAGVDVVPDVAFEDRGAVVDVVHETAVFEVGYCEGVADGNGIGVRDSFADGFGEFREVVGFGGDLGLAGGDVDSVECLWEEEGC